MKATPGSYMVESIGSHPQLPEDFAAMQNPSLTEKIRDYVNTHAQNLQKISFTFETQFKESNPLLKRLFHKTLEGVVTHVTSGIQTYLDSHANEHPLLPTEIDRIVGSSATYLDEQTMTAPPPLGSGEEAPPPEPDSPSSEGNLAQQVNNMSSHLFGGSSSASYSKTLSPQEMQLVTLCNAFFNAKSPMDKSEIYTELSRALGGENGNSQNQNTLPTTPGE